MIIKGNLIVDFDVKSKEDLKKLRPLVDQDLKSINYSALGRELNMDRRTVKKYIYGFEKAKHRVKPSKLDKYAALVYQLLFETKQIFRYKSFLYRYLVDNHDLDCSESSFMKWLTKNNDFNDYFISKRAKAVANKSLIRFENGLAEQAQLDWKESLTFYLKNGKEITLNILVCILSYSRFRVYKLSLDKTQQILFHFLDEIFETFGGVPKNY